MTGKVLITLTDITAVNPRMYILQGDSVKIVNIGFSGNTIQAIIPVNGQEQTVFLVDNGQVYTQSGNATLRTVNADTDPARYARFNNLKDQGAGKNFLIVSNKKIWTGANAYANYRQSKGFNVLLTDVEELYDQYAYGKSAVIAEYT